MNYKVEVFMRPFFLLSVLLLGTAWVVAQSTPAQSGQKSYNESATGQSGAERAVQGCLSNTGGQYLLTSDQGKTFILAGDTSKLDEHVGHEVIISGTRKSAGNTAGPSGESAGTMSDQANRPTLNVISVKHVSTTCKSGGAPQ
jgi:hypothetical protein